MEASAGSVRGPPCRAHIAASSWADPERARRVPHREGRRIRDPSPRGRPDRISRASPDVPTIRRRVPCVFPTRQIKGEITPPSPSRAPLGRAKFPANPALIIRREPTHVNRSPRDERLRLGDGFGRRCAQERMRAHKWHVGAGATLPARAATAQSPVLRSGLNGGGAAAELCPETCPQLGKSDPVEAGPTPLNLALASQNYLQMAIF
jgi:hypothetical protein